MLTLKDHILYIVAGLVYIAVGLPLYFEKVAPNRLYGFRTAETLSDPATWYIVNRVGGFDIAVVGVIVVLTSIATWRLSKRMKLPVASINLLVFIIGSVIAVVHGLSVL